MHALALLRQGVHEKVDYSQTIGALKEVMEDRQTA
jgi:hypothetical protein